MKKLLTLIVGLILIWVAFNAIKPIILLGIGVVVTFYCIRAFMKSPSSLGKLWWAIVGIVSFSTFFNGMPRFVIRHGHMHRGLLSMFSNVVPALVGIAAIALLYYGYKQWKNRKVSSSNSEYADFKNFEKEWEEMMSKHN